MTDSNATERLRALLDERGADYRVRHRFEDYDHFTVLVDGNPCASIDTGNSDEVVLTLRCTPEQAIAATLGRGECEVSYEQDGIPRCSNCQNVIYDEYKREDNGIKNYCDECGAKVRKAQCSRLREAADHLECERPIAASLMREAADTIETLRERLQGERGECENIAELNKDGVAGYYFVCSECGLSVHASFGIDVTVYASDMRTFHSGDHYEFERCPRCGRVVRR